jgi:hypothetical protein
MMLTQTQVARGAQHHGSLASALVCLVATTLPIGLTVNGTAFVIFDLALIGAAALFGVGTMAASLRSLVQGRRPRVTPLAVAVAGFLAAVGLSTVLRPGKGGVVAALTIVGAPAIAVVTRRNVLSRSGASSWFIRAITAIAVWEFGIGLSQVVRNGVIGVSWFGEVEAGFRPIAGLLAPSGTMIHANAFGVVNVAMAVALAVLLRWATGRMDRYVALVGLAACSGSATLSLTRGALLGLLILVAGLVATRDRLHRFAGGIVGMAMIVAVLARFDAWVARGTATTGGVEQAGSGRVALARQALAIFRADPIIGVGPGGYFRTIRDNPAIAELSKEFVPVHNLWLWVLATLGLVGVTALATLVGTVLWKIRSTGLLGYGFACVLSIPLMLDAALFMGCGLAWTAVCIGLLLGAADAKSPPLVSGGDAEQQDQSVDRLGKELAATSL